MNRRNKLRLLLLIASLFFINPKIVAGQEKALLVKEIIDKTFYQDFCLEADWSWLCQGESFSLSALKNEDDWFYFSQGFFDSESPGKEIVFVFSSLLAPPADQDQLTLALKSATPAIGVVNLFFDWGEDWQAFPDQGTNWLIFSGQTQKKDFSLKKIFPELDYISEQPWQLKIGLSPLIPGQPVMLAVDQLAIILSQDALPTPTPTPTKIESTPSPSPIPIQTEQASSKGEFLEPKNLKKVYFNEAIDLAFKVWGGENIDRLVLQYSVDKQSWRDVIEQKIDQDNYYWSYRWYPRQEGVFNLRVKIYNEGERLTVINHQAEFIFDQTPPKITWQKPFSQNGFPYPLDIEVEVEDDLSGIEGTPRFYYRYQDWGNSWRPIPANPWYFDDDLPLGDYWLRAQIADRAGNNKEEEIVLKRELEIFNIFLVENVLSWETSHPTFCRLVYDQFSRSVDGLQEEYPNFGYAWASHQLTNQKTTKHQYLLPQMPPGEYFGRIIALEKPIVYSAEFIFGGNHSIDQETGKNNPVLGESVKGEVNQNQEQERPAIKDQEGWLANINWLRVLAGFVLAFLVGGVIIYFLAKKTE